LSNGATVVLKPTTLRQDQILFRATAPGGTSLASDTDLIPARVADDVIPAGGVARYSAVMLDRILAGTAAAVTPFINETYQGMRGGSTPQDFQTMFQLLYLRFTQPRADPTAFASMASQARGLLANRIASPDVVFEQTLDAILTRNSPRRQFETPATVDQWNLEKSLAFYKARFADAGNFTFVFVGSFTLDTIKPLVETYIASLPATHARESWRDLEIDPPTGVVEKTVEKGIAPKSEVAIVFSGAFTYDPEHSLALATMTRVLQGRLFDTIRQELGGTYSITATPAAWKIPRPEYRVRIEWTCDPQRTAALVQRVFEELTFIKTTPLTPDQMTRLRDGLLRDYESNSQENGYLLEQIARRYADGDSASLGDIESLPDRIAALTPEAIHQAAQAYLDTSNYVKVTLMPETK
jgi:zinc protease